MANKNYDSEFCGSLPLHNINLIQPYGYLLVLQKEDFTVVQVSENTEELLNLPPADIINKSIERFLGKAQFETLKQKVATDATGKLPLSFNFEVNTTNQRMLALIHIKEQYLIIELEKVAENTDRYFTEVFQEIKYSMANIELAGSVQEVCDTAVRELRKLSGFDGIMMYRFDSNWNGTVIAEEKDEKLEKYLGYTFPASDVPKQARQLYLKNPYRLIPTRNYNPVRLYPVINPITHTFIDLSDCNLRSVAAVHLEYLKNMGVDASMSIRVIKDGELWGLISCHNTTPKYVNYEICTVFELLSSVVSNKISSIYSKEEFDREAELQNKRTSLIDKVYTESDLAAGLLKDKEQNLLDMFNATGAVVVNNNQQTRIGETPNEDSVENLVIWLQGKNVVKTYANDNLAAIYEDAAEYADIASGILAIPVDADKGNYIICFRPEFVKTVSWGGDPEKAINFEPDGKAYHPRNSFKLWQQTVRQTSLPWSRHEINAAEMLRSFAFEFQTKQLYN
ncbi:GAF domain-containing protein [Mucilaginibacter sp. RS28]|uniref:GAF domain-containing protein n=1 Tax=Mucilaginibacter straminoryzae TaxID=2932774 RepID=A0A9X1X4B2_9SPHI|nr:GAF domain-containing protein [Mucilaginibacter straminoryzae]MCJ8210852.1 GAF domain-containing protein [Mucilaginibacter straminoryzae]